MASSERSEGGLRSFVGSGVVRFCVCFGLVGPGSRPRLVTGGGKEERGERTWSGLF